MALLKRTAERARSRGIRLVLFAALAVGLALTGCGMDVQTLQPYTPAEGVNADVGPRGAVKVRNLLILSRTPGQGYLSGTLTAAGEDTLTEVTGIAVKADGADGSPLTATLSGPVPLGNNQLTVLTSRPLIMVSGEDLRAGLKARLTLRFGTAGETTLVVPVVDGLQTEYRTISPSPSPTATPSS